ncbi:MAG: response regulator [Chloroflexota bacterium]
MNDQSSSITYDEFAEGISEVLKHLYDSAYLQTHPLAEVLIAPSTETAHRSQALRRVMLEAIRTMYPQGRVSAQSPDWRSYKILELRYVQGLNWLEVMEKLGLGKTHYYRTHTLALEAITQMLWENTQQKSVEEAVASEIEPQTRSGEAQIDVRHLVEQADWAAISIDSILDNVKPMMLPLAQAKTSQLEFDVAHKLTILRADRVMLRQAILNLLSYTLDMGSGGRVAVQTFASTVDAGLMIEVWRGSEPFSLLPSRPRQGVGLEICEQLIWEMGGSLRINTQGEDHWQARLAWPTVANQTLLVIDDNDGLVELFRRYLAGSDWEIVGANNGKVARQQIEATKPGLIILDIMMPGEDGWELLTHFKQSDAYKDIPVVICSVLNEPQLAYNLGATAYLPKPVTQVALRHLLKPWHQAGATLD